MYEGIDCLFEDTELEDAFLRNVIECNEKFLDMRTWSEQKCREILTDEELQRYENVLPGTKLSTRRAKVISLLKANPCLRSTDPNVLYQRVSLYMWQYGEKTKKVRKPRKCPILKSVKKVLEQDGQEQQEE